MRIIVKYVLIISTFIDKWIVGYRRRFISQRVSLFFLKCFWWFRPQSGFEFSVKVINNFYIRSRLKNCRNLESKEVVF